MRCRPSCDALARLEGFQSWADLDVDEAESRANDHDAERARLQAGSSRLEEIARALAENAEQAAAVGELIEKLTGRLATTARRREGKRNKGRSATTSSSPRSQTSS